MLTAWCLTWADLVASEAIIRAEGRTATNPSGRLAVHPAVHIRAAAVRNLRLLAREFGWTAAAEIALASPRKPDVDDDDPFA
jgi:phage terminase small subunit